MKSVGQIKEGTATLQTAGVQRWRKSSDADPCHLVRVHGDVPDAALAVVVAAGVVEAGEGA